MSDRLRHVASVLSQPWAITPDMFEIVCGIIDRRVRGVSFTDEEVEAIIGESRAAFAGRHSSDHKLPTLVGRDAKGRFAAANHAASPAFGGGAQPALAIISLYGTITPRPIAGVSGGGTVGLTQFAQLVAAADADPSIRHILLDIDSPGGSTGLVEETAAVIRSVQTPTTAIANTMAASAAYWLAAQADEFVVTPSGLVGSIGIYARHTDESGAYAQEGLVNTVISAGPNKMDMSPYGPLTEGAKARTQAIVDELYGTFLEAIGSARGFSADEVEENFGGGAILTASQALAAGAVDRIATFDETVAGILNRQTTSLRASAPSLTLAAIEAPEDDEPPAVDPPEDANEDDLAHGEDLIPIDQTSAETESPAKPEQRPSGADKPALPTRIKELLARRAFGL
jgi:signal peptide peptidase SppA